MASGIANIGKVPELRRRLLITLALLAVYRVGIFVSIPGVDRGVMGQIMARSSGTLMGLFDMFAGGAVSQLSIFALGIMPYISSSIILQLLTVVSPTLAELRKEGDRYIQEAECAMEDTLVSSTTVTTGDVSTSYEATIETRYEPPLGGMSESSQTLKATWLGPCESGQKPGDVIGDDGMKFNLLDQ